MSTTTTSTPTALATIRPGFADSGRLALAGFLAGYRGLTREACTPDLRQFTSWCQSRSLPLFSVRRSGIGTFARELEAKGRARATVTRRLSTIAGFCKYASRKNFSPAARVRRPRLDYESHATGLDRNEAGALLVAAGPGPPAERALISLLALNGLRVPEAAGADIGHPGLERGHRPLYRGPQGRQGRDHPARPAHRTGDRPGHRRARRRAALRHCGRGPAGPARRRPHRAPRDPPGRDQQESRPAHAAARAHHRRPRRKGSRSATSRKQPPTPARAPPCATTAPAPASTGTPPTSPPRSSPGRPGRTEPDHHRPGQPGQLRDRLPQAMNNGSDHSLRLPSVLGNRLIRSIHSVASWSGVGRSVLDRCRPERLREISPARPSTFRCRDIVGMLIENGAASSATVASPVGQPAPAGLGPPAPLWPSSPQHRRV